MLVKELALQVLQNPSVNRSGIHFEDEDARPVIERILEGLALKASSGDPAAAKELREWINLQTEITL